MIDRKHVKCQLNTLVLKKLLKKMANSVQSKYFHFQTEARLCIIRHEQDVVLVFLLPLVVNQGHVFRDKFDQFLKAGNVIW